MDSIDRHFLQLIGTIVTLVAVTGAVYYVASLFVPETPAFLLGVFLFGVLSYIAGVVPDDGEL